MDKRIIEIAKQALTKEKDKEKDENEKRNASKKDQSVRVNAVSSILIILRLIFFTAYFDLFFTSSGSWNYHFYIDFICLLCELRSHHEITGYFSSFSINEHNREYVYAKERYHWKI